MTSLCLIIWSCQSPKAVSPQQWKQEILDTEKAFAETVKKEGIAAGFVKFAASDGVLNRNNQLLIGRKAISEHYGNIDLDGHLLEWKASFVEVSSSGDLGYTYGNYTYTIQKGSEPTVYTGIFHTVWKRQPDGNWRFVWD